MDCLISVIVPVYKVEKYIRRCVDSILAQTFTEFELILVDDGSPDNCGRICDEYAEKDERIHVIHKENGGLSDARNAGIDWAFANSNSEWITFIDSDDWVHPRYLELLYNATKESELCLSICMFKETDFVIPNAELSVPEWKYYNTEKLYCDKPVNAIVAWGKLYPKRAFLHLRYPVGKIHEDEFTTYKILFMYKQVAVLSCPLYYYFQNEEGITKSQWSLRRLDINDALFEQCIFFINNGYKEAAERACDVLCCNLIDSYNRLLRFEMLEKNKHIHSIRTRMRFVLRYKGVHKPIEGFKTAYGIGHPLLFRLYKIENKVKKKIMRLCL